MRRPLLHLAVVALFLSAALMPATVAGEPGDDVKAAFFAYKTAVMNDRGAEAADLLSSSTVRYYEAMRDLALYADASRLKQQSTVDLMQAMIMRLRVPTEQLRGMSGRELLRYAIDHGWIGKNTVAPVRPSDVRVEGDTAVVDVVSDRDSGSIQMQFVKEDGAWKLDLTLTIESVGIRLDMMAEQQGMSSDEVVLSILSSMNGTPVDASIWVPPLKRTGGP